MDAESLTPASTAPRRTLVLVLCALLLLAGGAAGIWFWRQYELNKPYPGEWKTLTLERLTFEAPFAFEESQDLSSSLPEEIREVIQAMRSYAGGRISDGLRCEFSYARYAEGVKLDLDGAVGGAMSQGAAALGDTAPQYSTEAIEIAGLPGRRVVYRQPRGRGNMQLSATFLAHGQELWQLQAIATTPAARKAAERILASVKPAATMAQSHVPR